MSYTDFSELLNVMQDMQGGTPTSLGSTTTANAMPVVVASDQIVPVSGALTANIGTTGGLALDSSLATIEATQSLFKSANHTDLLAVISALGSPFQSGGSIGNTTFASTQSGTWNINNIAGAISLPTGASTASNQTTANTSLSTIASNQTNGTQQSKITDLSSNGFSSTAASGTASNKRGLDVTQLAAATGRYSAPVRIRQTAATAANGTVWAMRNGASSTKTVYIEKIYIAGEFNAASAATRALLGYNLVRFSAATPSGGTALTAAKFDSSDSASQVTDIRFLDTGLTTSGVTFETDVLVFYGIPNFGTAISNANQDNIGIKLAPGEGLAIRLNVAAAIGLEISGTIIWREQ